MAHTLALQGPTIQELKPLRSRLKCPLFGYLEAKSKDIPFILGIEAILLGTLEISVDLLGLLKRKAARSMRRGKEACWWRSSFVIKMVGSGLLEDRFWALVESLQAHTVPPSLIT